MIDEWLVIQAFIAGYIFGLLTSWLMGLSA
jgi:hypothetical protein